MMSPSLHPIVLLRRFVALPLAFLMVWSAPRIVEAYHFFHILSPLPLPVAWRTLPITVIVDSDPVSFRTLTQSALNAWNNVATATDMFGTPTVSTVNFTGANYLTAWGLPNDGKFEAVCDSDGSVATALSLSPGTLGYAPTTKAVIAGQGAITDGFFILNCSTAESADFSYLATMVHELGHALGLAHSSAYLADSGRLQPLPIIQAPTMYPFAIPGNDSQSASLEADDIAGISQLYPAATFATTYSTLSGIVTQCGTNDPVTGVNVRAVRVGDSRSQITRYTGFDGNTTGSYEIKVPAGNYNVVVEVMTLPLDRMAMLTAAANDITTEYRSTAPEEDGCLEEIPDTAVNLASPAGGTLANQHIKTNAVELAFVVDDTGSMGPEIGAVRTTLTNQIARLAAVTTRPFPTTAIVTFKDDVTIRKVSRDPAVLQSVVSTLFASGGGDCPEFSNNALIVAGNLLRRGGTAMLFTDADSHSSGASAGAVASLYTAKGLRTSVLLSGSCTSTLRPDGNGDDTADASEMDPALSQNPPEPGEDLSARTQPPPTLGTQTSVQTYSSIVAATGGLFTAIPGIKTANATETSRYVNTGTNIAVSATLPTVGLVSPADGPRGTTLDVEIVGSNTNFQGASLVSFSGTGITVNFRLVRSATSMTANITIASTAPLGFRDVTVTTPFGGGATEVAAGVGAFNVTAVPTTPTIISVGPSSAMQGQTMNVTITAAATTFTSASRPVFCINTCSALSSHDAKIAINAVTVTDANNLVANITVAPDATIAFRNVAVITGAQIARESVPGPFLVTGVALSIPRLTSVSPSTGWLGASFTLAVTGANTSFVNGVSVASFTGTGITVNSTTINSPTSATVSISVGAGASLGFRDVLITTGGETAVLVSGFNVTATPPTAEPPTQLRVASIVGDLVTLRWVAPTFGLSPTGYVVEGGVAPGQVLAGLPTGSTYPVISFNAPAGAFYIRVHTLAGASKSSASNEVRLYVNVPQPPSAPTNLTGTVSGSSIALAWRNTYLGAAPIAIGLEVTGSRSGTVPLPVGDKFLFNSMPSGTYTFRVRGANAGGISDPSNSVTLTFPASCSGPPLLPGNFLAYRVGRLLVIVWDSPASGPAPSGYVLNATGSANASIPTPGNTLFGTVPPGTYSLSVIATNACGSSAATPVQTVVVP